MIPTTLYKKGVAFESLGEKSCEIKCDSHEVAAIISVMISIEISNSFVYLLSLTSLQPFIGCHL